MPTFDGDTLTITLDSGVTEVDVRDDIYSPWKEWAKEGTNIRYPLAFRPDGGAALSAIINQGSYFFLNNSAGWRIKPPEENITIYLTGNLAVEDTTLPATTPTIGAYTTAIIGLQPVTQGVTPVMASQLEHAAFNGGVTINVVTGAAGTNYPTGTETQPSDNLIDALAITSARGFENLFVQGDLTIGAGENISNYNIRGRGATANVVKTRITFAAGCVATNTYYEGCKIDGEQGGESRYTNCVIGELTNANCHYEYCTLIGPVIAGAGIGGTHVTHFHECYSTTNEFVYDQNDSQLKMVFVGFTGLIKFINGTHASAVVRLNVRGGVVTIDSTCTAGTYIITGNCTVVDNSAGATVDVTGVIADGVTTEKAAIIEKILRNKTVTDPTTGIMTIYDDNDVTVLFQTTVYENVAGSQTYRGQGADRKDRLE
jgi:hypothetical protein